MSSSDEEQHHSILQGRRSVPKFDPHARVAPAKAPPEDILGPPTTRKHNGEERKLSEKMLRMRSGNRIEPYPKVSGGTTARFTATLDTEVVQRERVFMAKLCDPKWNRAKFLETAILRAIEEYERKGSLG